MAESVVKQSPNGFTGIALDAMDYTGITISIADAADNMHAWGTWPRTRDHELRLFWPTENWLASTLYAAVARYAAFEWSLEGPPRTTAIIQDKLHQVEFGNGWVHLMAKVLTDLFTQDNGAFIEIVREADNPLSPMVSLNHLDSGQCVRTGRRAEPVLYYDIFGKAHLLKWYQVMTLEEMPSPIERMRGYQYCAVTRILKYAQIMKEITTYKKEKVSGRFHRALHLVGGVQGLALKRAIEDHDANADASNLLRYSQPVVIAALDPTATVSHQEILLAALPEDYNEDEAMKWYITALALAFGSDYQELAPMPGGGIGSGNQAKVMHAKSRGKGPAMFMALLQQKFNFHGIMPRSVRFKMGEVDLGAEMEKTMLQKEQALVLETLVRSGTITTEVARQIAVDRGLMDERYLRMMREEDATNETRLRASEPPPIESEVKPGKPGPDEPPGTKEPVVTTAPPNNNAKRTKPPSQSQKVTV